MASNCIQIWRNPICAGQWIFQFLTDSVKRKSAWKADGLMAIYFCSTSFPLPVLTPHLQPIDWIAVNWIELVCWNMMHYIACLLCCCQGNGCHIGWPNCTLSAVMSTWRDARATSNQPWFWLFHFPVFTARNSPIRSAFFTVKRCSHQSPAMHSLAFFLSVIITVTSCRPWLTLGSVGRGTYLTLFIIPPVKPIFEPFMIVGPRISLDLFKKNTISVIISLFLAILKAGSSAVLFWTPLNFIVQTKRVL